MTYTIEAVNELLGSRQHRKATTYDSLEAASARAEQEANRCRKFAVLNVLDSKGREVASFRGKL